MVGRGLRIVLQWDELICKTAGWVGVEHLCSDPFCKEDGDIELEGWPKKARDTPLLHVSNTTVSHVGCHSATSLCHTKLGRFPLRKDGFHDSIDRHSLLYLHPTPFLSL